MHLILMFPGQHKINRNTVDRPFKVAFDALGFRHA
jgi:hypothetical protein